MRTKIIIAGVLAVASQDAWSRHSEFMPPGAFQLNERSIGGAKPGRATTAAQTSSRIAPLGDGALVIDADSGALVRTNRAGEPVASVDIAGDAGLLVYDPTARRAFVADRRGDRIVVVDVGDALTVVRGWRTPAEPYGLALTPDRQTLLVTTIADRALVAYDPSTGAERWRVPLDAEPRAVAIAADGKHAAVTSLTSGAVQTVALDGDHAIDRRALPVRFTGQVLRGSFAAAYLGDHIIAAPFQRDLPANTSDGVSDHYGGNIDPPIGHELAFLGDDGEAVSAIMNVNEPRAVAWDPGSDSLYVVGMAADRLTRVDHASQVDVRAGETTVTTKGCGPDGVTVGGNGDVLVWCSFSRTVVRFAGRGLARSTGPELVPSKLDALAHDGMVMFHSANVHVSQFAGLSCGNCHLDGRADGVSWLIHDERLQTPMLAGRVVGTAPFKWDGTAPTLASSLRQTIQRLGGSGLSTHHTAALVAYLEAMPAVRTPTRPAAEVARGKQLFESAELGCTSCHDGAKYTDQERHRLGRTKTQFDTPSLVGLAASAPYFHDGSAPTLEAVLRDRGLVHGMATEATSVLTDTQLGDLRAYLETL